MERNWQMLKSQIFRCDPCCKLFTTFEALHTHCKLGTCKEKSAGDSSAEKSPTVRSPQCGVCDQLFLCEDDLKLHWDSKQCTEASQAQAHSCVDQLHWDSKQCTKASQAQAHSCEDHPLTGVYPVQLFEHDTFRSALNPQPTPSTTCPSSQDSDLVPKVKLDVSEAVASTSEAHDPSSSQMQLASCGGRGTSTAMATINSCQVTETNSSSLPLEVIPTASTTTFACDESALPASDTPKDSSEMAIERRASVEDMPCLKFDLDAFEEDLPLDTVGVFSNVPKQDPVIKNKVEPTRDGGNVVDTSSIKSESPAETKKCADKISAHQIQPFVKIERMDDNKLCSSPRVKLEKVEFVEEPPAYPVHLEIKQEITGNEKSEVETFSETSGMSLPDKQSTLHSMTAILPHVVLHRIDEKTPCEAFNRKKKTVVRKSKLVSIKYNIASQARGHQNSNYVKSANDLQSSLTAKTVQEKNKTKHCPSVNRKQRVFSNNREPKTRPSSNTKADRKLMGSKEIQKDLNKVGTEISSVSRNKEAVRKSTSTSNNETVPLHTCTCPVCDAEFSSKKSLDIHFSRIHQGLSMFICKVCNISFTTRMSIVIHHLQVHTALVPSSLHQTSASSSAGNAVPSSTGPVEGEVFINASDSSTESSVNGTPSVAVNKVKCSSMPAEDIVSGKVLDCSNNSSADVKVTKKVADSSVSSADVASLKVTKKVADSSAGPDNVVSVNALDFPVASSSSADVATSNKTNDSLGETVMNENAKNQQLSSNNSDDDIEVIREDGLCIDNSQSSKRRRVASEGTLVKLHSFVKKPKVPVVCSVREDEELKYLRVSSAADSYKERIEYCQKCLHWYINIKDAKTPPHSCIRKTKPRYANRHYCGYCSKDFVLLQTLVSHMGRCVSHKGNIKETSEVVNVLGKRSINARLRAILGGRRRKKSNAPKVKFTKVCHICRLQFPSEESLQQHLENRHPLSVHRFVCGVCEIVFGSYEDLVTHMPHCSNSS